jgi:hypothetical protein
MPDKKPRVRKGKKKAAAKEPREPRAPRMVPGGYTRRSEHFASHKWSDEDWVRHIKDLYESKRASMEWMMQSENHELDPAKSIVFLHIKLQRMVVAKKAHANSKEYSNETTHIPVSYTNALEYVTRKMAKAEFKEAIFKEFGKVHVPTLDGAPTNKQVMKALGHMMVVLIKILYMKGYNSEFTGKQEHIFKLTDEMRHQYKLIPKEEREARWRANSETFTKEHRMYHERGTHTTNHQPVHHYERLPPQEKHMASKATKSVAKDNKFKKFEYM